MKFKQRGAVMLIVLAGLAIIVTLGVAGIINKNSETEKVADEIIKDETGVDLQKVEENVLKK